MVGRISSVTYGQDPGADGGRSKTLLDTLCSIAARLDGSVDHEPPTADWDQVMLRSPVPVVIA